MLEKTTLLLAAALMGGAASSAGNTRGEETAIPFVRSNGILDWKAASDDSLYVRGSNGRWYMVRTMNRCPRLKTAITLGFDTSALDQLDRHGAILAEGWRCPIDTITFSEGPPRKRRHRR